MVIHKDKKYKVFSLRLDEEVKKELQKRRREKKLSWNLLLRELLWHLEKPPGGGIKRD